jgi:EAL domain-containing protein (putative c-di-GMP-specific phosphodiesterase class I)
MFVGVNVSAREIQQPGFVLGVRETLREAALSPTSLILEITETALLRATPTTIATLAELRSLGVRTVIDDFGTGYFSLSHLRQFPVDVLKVASEFVQDDGVDSKSSALAGAIVALSRSLGITTVAEGIETAEQAARMRDLGCEYGQGYFFARPMTSAEFVDVLHGGVEAAVPTTPDEASGQRVPAPTPASGRRPGRRPRPVRTPTARSPQVRPSPAG